MPTRAAARSSFVTREDRAALLRDGVVVLSDGRSRSGRYVVVTAAEADRARVAVRRQLGAKVVIEVVGTVPGRLVPRACEGYTSHWHWTLDVSVPIRDGERVDGVLVEEDERAVVVLATVRTNAIVTAGRSISVSYCVRLDRPLGGRILIDGVTGAELPVLDLLAPIGAQAVFVSAGDPPEDVDQPDTLDYDELHDAA
jgi:hypothetical protein